MPGGYRRWCFTINNPQSDVLFSELPQDLKFVCWQLEQGEQGTRHFQGYCICTGPFSMGRVKRALGCDSAHLEPARGTHEQCVAYCSKEDTRVLGPWKLGDEPAGQGARTDLEWVAEEVKKSRSDREIAQERPTVFMRYFKGINALRMALADPPRRASIQTMVLHGGTGTGKTFWAYDKCPGLYRVLLPAQRGAALWWDGYIGQDAILFDDFYGQIDLATMLHLLDPYPLTLAVKGSFTLARWTKVIITSNKSPMDWYSGTDPDPMVLAALMRRLHSMVQVDSREDLPNQPIWA